MLCSETDSQVPAVKIPLPFDVARDLGYWMKAIIDAGGNGRILLDVSGGSVVGTEVTVKRPRKKS